MRFNRLRVVYQADEGDKPRKNYWVCECDCGTLRTVRGDHLRSGATMSCGCRRAEVRRTHGMAHTSENTIWRCLRQRCGNPKHPEYKNYGGRGIFVDPRWDKFEAFIGDMGLRPTDKHEVDRIDNDGPYAPWNCRWATRTEQCANQRRNVMLTFHGETLPRSAMARRYGIDVSTLKYRMRMGWSLERALLEPPTLFRKKHTI